jgi:integrase
MDVNKIRTATPHQATWDKGSPKSVTGLHLRVKPNGTKSFFLYYRTRSGQQRRPKLGDWGVIGLDEARSRARAILSKVAQGDDPKLAWDTLRAELSIQELYDTCWNEYWNKPRFQASGWAKQVSYNYRNHLKYTFGRLKVSQVSTVKICEWLESFEEKPVAGNRSLEVLSRLMKFAMTKGWCKVNPCAGVTAFTEQKRKRYATREEIERVSQILNREYAMHPRSVLFIYLLMFTGARPRAIERATWQQLTETTFNGHTFGILTLDGKTTEKTGDQEVIVLPPFVLSLLNDLPKTGTLTGIKMPSGFWRKVRLEAKCTGLWARDWRRTFATIGLGAGLVIDQIGEALNHKSTQTTKVYAQLSPETRIKVCLAIADQLEALMALKNSEETNPGGPVSSEPQGV